MKRRIVIEINDDYYRALVTAKTLGKDLLTLEKAVADGTPLPKGHGDLIDRKELEPFDCDFDNGFGCDKICHCDNCEHQMVKASRIKNAHVIIEADKENGNESAD